MPCLDRYKEATRLIVDSRSSHDPMTALPPVYHAASVFFDSVEEFEEARRGITHGEPNLYPYGTVGTPTTTHLANLISSIEGKGHDCRSVLVPTGKHAITATLLAFLSNGDHVLMADSVYGPTRVFAEIELPRFGIEVEFFDPLIEIDMLAGKIRDNTRMVYVESPGTFTFDVLDVPAIASVACERGILVAVDNAWGSPFFGKPFDWGADISILPLTKFWNGHSDVLMGAIVVRSELWASLWHYVQRTSPTVSGDDAYLVLRGMRTVAVRLKHHEASGLALAEWLEGQEGIARVLHPALPSFQSHSLWQRDFTGSCGLFSIQLTSTGDSNLDLQRAKLFCNTLKLFRIGGSWGGIESMVLIGAVKRTESQQDGPPLIRLFAGLEDVADLRDDLTEGLKAVSAI